MRRLSALLLACTLILIACVPTTHATGTDPDKPLPHLTTNLETPIVADDGGWGEIQAKPDGLTVIKRFQRVLSIYARAYIFNPFLNSNQPEADSSYDFRQSDTIAPSGSTNSR
jgi:hypothetical protein